MTITPDGIRAAAEQSWPKQGDRVTFKDGNVTRTGFVNGDTVRLPSSREQKVAIYVPVFSERDKGREPTTIMVHLENVISVEPRA